MLKKSEDFLILFGGNVRAIRQQKGLSQEELAQLAGLDRTYMGGIERGERNLGLINVKKISEALGIKVKDLFDDNFKL
jgi:transcriptional regulator with XRE-family HTH domain